MPDPISRCAGHHPSLYEAQPNIIHSFGSENKAEKKEEIAEITPTRDTQAVAETVNTIFIDWEQVPDELAMHILSFLDHQTLGRLAQTNQKFKQLTNDSNLWKEKCKQISPNAPMIIEQTQNQVCTKEIYRKILTESLKKAEVSLCITNGQSSTNYKLPVFNIIPSLLNIGNLKGLIVKEIEKNKTEKSLSTKVEAIGINISNPSLQQVNLPDTHPVEHFYLMAPIARLNATLEANIELSEDLKCRNIFPLQKRIPRNS